MSNFEAKPEVPKIVRLFPLPDLVMFPKSLQMLYLFEPRYVQMIEAAIASDHTIAMALLKSGWESDYDGEPAVHDTVCLGKIVSFAKKSDGHFNVLLSGVARATILHELQTDFLFRTAEIQIVEEKMASDDLSWGLQSLLCDRLRSFLVHAQVADELLAELKQEAMGLNELVDVISFTIPMDLETKQHLLSEPNVEHRAQFLIDFMAVRGAMFPTSDGQAQTDYSLN